MADQRQHDKAIDMYNRAIELDPNYADAYHNRALEYSKKGNYKQAIPDFSKAIENKPDRAQGYNDRACAYAEVKEYDKSWTDVHKAEESGYKVHPDFLRKLKAASGRQN